jgi:hypothetical protein
MTEQNKETLEQQYPAVELAYPIAVASYDVALRRIDAMDGRLQTVMAFVVTVSAAIPPLASNRGVHFHSYWFYAAAATLLLTISIGIYARLMGEIKVVDPNLLFNSWLHKPDWEFKKDFIAFAGDDFNSNVALSELKWKFSIVVTLLFFLEVVFFAAWVMGSA